MANIYTTQPYEPSGYQGGFGLLRRVSWGALFAGIIVTLIIELLLAMLGMAVGLGIINPATADQSQLGGIGIGAGIWLGISTLIALFVGGWFTAKLAGSPRGLNGVLHSIVMWGSVTLLSFYLVSTAIGSLVSGVAGIVGKGISAAAPSIQQELQKRGITPGAIINEAQKKMGQAGQQKGGGRQGAAAGGQNQPSQQTDQAKQQAVQTTQQAASALSKVALWMFILMILGAGAAAWGGWLGAGRKREIERPAQP